jgi:hypothetical protein
MYVFYRKQQIVSLNPAHDEVYSKQHYVIKFDSGLRQVGVFLHQFPSLSKLQVKGQMKIIHIVIPLFQFHWLKHKINFFIYFLVCKVQFIHLLNITLRILYNHIHHIFKQCTCVYC